MSHKPSDKQNDAPSSKDYLGTGIARRELAHQNTMNTDSDSGESDSEPAPMEVLKKWWWMIANPQDSNGIVAAFTVVIALTGIFYTIFSAGQAYIMGKQLEAMRDDLRARVGAQSVHEHRGDGPVVEIGVNFVNSGKTPALEVQTVLYDAKILPLNSLPPACAPPVNSPIKSLLQPTQTIYTPIQVSRQDWASAAVEGTKHLFVYGRVDYKDVSHIPHWTSFCYYRAITGLNEPSLWGTCHNQCNATEESEE